MIDLRRTSTSCSCVTFLSAILILIGSFLLLVYALGSARAVLDRTSTPAIPSLNGSTIADATEGERPTVNSTEICAKLDNNTPASRGHWSLLSRTKDY